MRHGPLHLAPPRHLATNAMLVKIVDDEIKVFRCQVVGSHTELAQLKSKASSRFTKDIMSVFNGPGVETNVIV